MLNNEVSPPQTTAIQYHAIQISWAIDQSVYSFKSTQYVQNIPVKLQTCDLKLRGIQEIIVVSAIVVNVVFDNLILVVLTRRPVSTSLLF